MGAEWLGAALAGTRLGFHVRDVLLRVLPARERAGQPVAAASGEQWRAHHASGVAFMVASRLGAIFGAPAERAPEDPLRGLRELRRQSGAELPDQFKNPQPEREQ